MQTSDADGYECDTYSNPKRFKAGKAFRLHSPCPVCHEGTLSDVVPLDADERMEARCGRLLRVKCTKCRRWAWAYQDKQTLSDRPLPKTMHYLCSGRGCAVCGWRGTR